ncbi:MAG: NTP transferase domain-containing protein [Caldilineaceae bacterium]
MQERFDAVILAGYDRNRSQYSPDPLVAQSGEPHKVLIKVAGKPMIWHVVNALANSRFIDRIVIVGLSPEDGVAFGRTVDYLPDQGGMMDNMVYGFSWLAQQESPAQYALLLTGDIPLLTGAMIDWFIEASQPLAKDVYWGIVEKQTMEATFPNSKRSYLRLVEGQFCSGDLFLGKMSAALGRQALFKQMVDHRKSVLQQLRLLGFRVVFKFLLRRLRMQDLLELFPRLLGLTGGAVILPFAEVGMDVDKPHQLTQVLAYLETHAQAATTNQLEMNAPNA